MLIVIMKNLKPQMIVYLYTFRRYTSPILCSSFLQALSSHNSISHPSRDSIHSKTEKRDRAEMSRLCVHLTFLAFIQWLHLLQTTCTKRVPYSQMLTISKAVVPVQDWATKNHRHQLVYFSVKRANVCVYRKWQRMMVTEGFCASSAT